MAAGRTAAGARKAALAKGRRKRAFMVGYLDCGSARCGGGPIRARELAGRAADAPDWVCGARGDGS
jgi:hypothetical protein